MTFEGIDVGKPVKEVAEWRLTLTKADQDCKQALRVCRLCENAQRVRQHKQNVASKGLGRRKRSPTLIKSGTQREKQIVNW